MIKAERCLNQQRPGDWKTTLFQSRYGPQWSGTATLIRNFDDGLDHSCFRLGEAWELADQIIESCSMSDPGARVDRS